MYDNIRDRPNMEVQSARAVLRMRLESDLLPAMPACLGDSDGCHREGDLNGLQGITSLPRLGSKDGAEALRLLHCPELLDARSSRPSAVCTPGCPRAAQGSNAGAKAFSLLWPAGVLRCSNAMGAAAACAPSELPWPKKERQPRGKSLEQSK